MTTRAPLKRAKDQRALERFLLLEQLEYAQTYSPNGFADISSIRKAIIYLLKKEKQCQPKSSR